jgi:hypothetical protein
MNGSSPVVQTLVSIVFFPILFQQPAAVFSWGAGDVWWIMVLKRLFVLLPALAFIAACWLTIVSLFTVIFRRSRMPFLTSLVITWWNLFKSFFLFWGGIFRFVFELILTVLGLLRIALLTLWSFVVDILFFPFKVIAVGVRGIMGASVPWIALVLTLFWCLIEALIFTYVTMPLISDVLYVATARYLSEAAIQVPLFIFLFFIVLASYAMLSSLFEVTRKKKIMAIIGMFFVELFVVFFEVMFLYREFVDALVPWFAQYSENFNPGPVVIILFAFAVWFGIRALSWFLFASKGTPFILKIIRGEKIKVAPVKEGKKTNYLGATSNLLDQIKRESRWLEEKGTDFLAALLLPPLQIVAAVINFVILLFSGKHLFQLPLKKLSDLQPSPALIHPVVKEKPPRAQKPPGRPSEPASPDEGNRTAPSWEAEPNQGDKP